METSRLYIALLILVAVFIALFAYRTKRSQLHFMKLSRIDGLTGIDNRPYFIAQAERELEASRKLAQEVCVILCDLDHFKSINDKFGHAAGDQVLRQAVQACRAHLRASDLFGRFGGEEFCILLPGCSLADARQRCEQLRGAIATIATDTGAMRPSRRASAWLRPRRRATNCASSSHMPTPRCIAPNTPGATASCSTTPCTPSARGWKSLDSGQGLPSCGQALACATCWPDVAAFGNRANC